jgi:hypothetical protein
MRPYLIGALAVVAACGGANAVDVFNSSDGGAGSSDASTSSDGTTSGDGSTTGDSGNKPDGSNPNPSNPDPGLIACGNDLCTRTGAVREFCCFTPTAQTCQPEAAVATCSGSWLLCDEKVDCETGVCCMEAEDSGRVRTRCLATCVTGVPRYQVCKTNGECESGSCKAYDCGSNMPPLKFCQRPLDCK